MGIGDAVDLARMKRILLAFHRSTGLDAIMVNGAGHPVVQPTMERQASFCRLIQTTSNGAEKCHACYSRATSAAAELGEPYVFRCHAGLVCWAAPILGGPQPAAVICNQVLMWEPDDQFWLEVAEATNLSREDCEPLIEAAQQLELVEPQRVQAAAELLMAIANALSPNPILGEGVRTPNGPQELIRQETRVAVAMDSKAILPAPQRLLERENMLLHRVRLRDMEGAVTLLSELLADLLQTPQHLSARVLELLALISRAAIEAGVNEEAVFATSTLHFTRMTEAVDAASKCAVAREALLAFMATVRPPTGGARHQLLMHVMEYLRENYCRQDLSLEQIARVVHLSPAYLSHLFRKELDMTMTQYLTSIRLEVAKKVLRETDTPVFELALNIGYADAGYFCKLFKRYFGLSPGAYRQQFHTHHRLAVSGGT